MASHLVRHVVRVGGTGRVLIAAAALGALAPPPAMTQLVTPKTVPVHNSGQFAIFPSSLEGMAGAGLALDDSLLDPLVNPAKASRARTGAFISTPFSHSVSGDRGGGRTLPLAGIVPLGKWSVAGVVALQQLDREGPMRFAQATSERAAMNQYVTGSVARRLSDGLSVGASGSWGDLGAVDGVDLLYAGSDHILQRGETSDLRLGVLKELGPGKSVEFLVLRNRFAMTHDVHYTTFTWDSAARRQVRHERTERNDDRTDTWGAHLRYLTPYGTDGWRFGWVATINRAEHPHIPVYQLPSNQLTVIPRDPGTTWGVNGGVGISKVSGRTTFAADVIFEPMHSNTWADAARDTAIAGQDTVRKGSRTVENEFHFSNVMARLGLGHEIPVGADSADSWGFQLGLAVYSINYRLDQTNNVANTFRLQNEGWMEWSRTLGLSYRTRDITIRYTYTNTCSTGSCDMNWGWGGDKVTVASPSAGDAGTAASPIIVAPNAPLQFTGGTATTHRLSVTLPIR